MHPQFARFFIVGGLNASFGYGLFALFVWLGLPYAFAIGLATIAGIAFNYQSTGRLVFGVARWQRVPRFLMVYAFTYVLNLAGVHFLLQFGLNIYLANATMVFPLALIAYILQRKFVFSSL